MWRTSFVLAVIAAALLLPTRAGANHAGCVAHTAAPTCEYTAIGSHSCAGYTEATYEVFVFRPVWDEELQDFVLVKVVLASGEGAVVGTGVAAQPDEDVTLAINEDGTGDSANGIVSCGNTAGHP